MSVRKIIALHGLVLGGVFGALVSYAGIESSLKAAMIGGVIGAVVGGALPFIPVEGLEGLEALFSLGELLNCCSVFGFSALSGEKRQALSCDTLQGCKQNIFFRFLTDW